MVDTRFNVKITNWDKHQEKLKRNHSHFMVSKRIFNDEKIAQLKPIEFQLYLYCLSICADMMSNQFTISAKLVPKYMRISDKSMRNCLDRLQSFQLLTYDKDAPNRRENNTKENNTKEDKGITKKKEPPAEQVPPPQKELPEMILLFNSTTINFSKVLKTNEKRNKKINKLWPQLTPDEWRTVFKKINDSDFCCGKNDRGWRASFDWILQDEVYLKVLEGKYDNRKSNTRDRGHLRDAETVAEEFEQLLDDISAGTANREPVG